MKASRAAAAAAAVLIASWTAREARADDCHEHRHAHPHPAGEHHHHPHSEPHGRGTGHHHSFSPGDAMAPQCHERPVVVGVDPSSGPPGTVVRITGRFFTARDRVFLGAVEEEVSERLPNRITLTIAQGSRSGRFRIDGPYTIESPYEFRVTETLRPPLVNRFSPVSGPPGTEVTIVGQNFAPRVLDNQVLIGDRPLTIRGASISEIRVIIPEGTRSGPVTVRVPGAGEGISQATFTVTEPLVISDFQPRFGGINSEVRFTGSGIPTNTRDIRVSLGGRPCRVVAATATSLRAVILPGATTGRFDIAAQGGGRVETAFIFSVTNPPVISRILPASGPPGTILSIQGSHFGASAADVGVQINGREARLTGSAPVSDRQVTVAVPPGVTSGPLTLTVRGQGTAISPSPFMVLEALVIGDVSPRAGAPGSEVIIRGSGFSPSLRGQIVRLASRACRVIAATANELRVVLPADAITGLFEIEVRGLPTVRSPQPFQVMNPPVIERFEPLSGTPGADVAIYGANLGTSIAQVRVSLAGRPCVVRSLGAGLVVAQVPQGAVRGRFQIEVEGQGSAETSRDFDVMVPVTVASFSPQSGPPNTVVTLNGTGFSTNTRDNTVRLGTTTLRVLAAASAQLQVVVGQGASTGRFSVAVRGREQAESRGTFTVDAAVVVDDFSPRAGPIGSEVLIRGRGFDAAQGGIRVTIGGRTCRVVDVAPTELRVQIPPGAVTAPLRVNVRRMGEAESRDAFTVAAAIAALSIASIDPLAVPMGGHVRVRGAGFGGDPRAVRVTVANRPVQIVLLTPDTIEFVAHTVPGNRGRIRIQVIGVGEVESLSDLVIGPPPPVVQQPPPGARRY